MKPITGTVAAVTAAAAITGGVAFYNTATDGTTTRSATAEIIDDVHPVTVDVPRVSLPTGRVARRYCRHRGNSGSKCGKDRNRPGSRHAGITGNRK